METTLCVLYIAIYIYMYMYCIYVCMLIHGRRDDEFMGLFCSYRNTSSQIGQQTRHNVPAFFFPSFSSLTIHIRICGLLIAIDGLKKKKERKTRKRTAVRYSSSNRWNFVSKFDSANLYLPCSFVSRLFYPFSAFFFNFFFFFCFCFSCFFEENGANRARNARLRFVTTESVL